MFSNREELLLFALEMRSTGKRVKTPSLSSANFQGHTLQNQKIIEVIRDLLEKDVDENTFTDLTSICIKS